MNKVDLESNNVMNVSKYHMLETLIFETIAQSTDNLKELIKNKDNEIQYFNESIRNKDDQIHSLENSISWKITSPFRYLYTKLTT